MVKKRLPKPAQTGGGAPRPRTSEWSEEVFLPLLNGFILGFLGGGEDAEKRAVTSSGRIQMVQVV